MGAVLELPIATITSHLRFFTCERKCNFQDFVPLLHPAAIQLISGSQIC